MNVTVRLPTMTRDEFLDWVQRQEGRHEFDGYRPLAMTGGTRVHAKLQLNIGLALRARLDMQTWDVLIGESGIATIGNSVRYPDVLVATHGPDGDLLIPNVVVVFEIISPSSERNDRMTKVREYRDVPSIRRYVIVEQATMGATVLSRAKGQFDWTATVLTADETLALPELGIDVPVRGLYAGTAVPDGEAG